MSVDKKILRYVELNPGTTINKLTNYLTKEMILSYVPARNKIIELIDEGIIEDGKKGNSFHRLFISDKSDFVKIDKQLTEIESFLDVMNKSIRNIFSKPSTDLDLNRSIVLKVRWLYEDYLLYMIRILLEVTTERIESEKHSQILHNKIVGLISKLDHDLIKSDRRPKINHEAHFIKTTLEDYLKKNSTYKKSLNNLLALSEKLKESMLSFI